MKKLLILFLFLLMASPCLGADHWVYVRLEDRSGVTQSDDAGRSKRGDVVAVLPVNNQNIPTQREKEEYMIVKVSNLAQEKIDTMLEPDLTEISGPDGVDYVAKATRKNKMNFENLGISVKKGASVSVVNQVKIKMSKKTALDFISYEMKRQFYAGVYRPLKLVHNRIVGPAYAETVSTINKSGEDYNTLALWEDAVDGDLVSETRQETAEIYDDEGALSVSGTTINGSTTNATYYMKVTAPVGERHDGTLSDGSSGNGALLTRSSNAILVVSDPYTVIEWVQISNTGANSSDYPFYNSAGGTVYVNNCIIHTNRAQIRGYNNSGQQFFNTIIYRDGANTNSETLVYMTNWHLAQNCTIIGNAYTGSLWYAKENNGNYHNVIFDNSASGGLAIHNETNDADSESMITSDLTAYFGTSISTGTSTSTTTDKLVDSGATFESDGVAINQIVRNTTDSTTTYVTAIDSETQLSVDDDLFASGEAYEVKTSFSVVLTYESAASDNYHLASGDTEAIDTGADLGTTSNVNIDIDGRDRDSEGDTWDIGADEYVAAAGGERRIIMVQ